jgi:hypothetical protein
MISEFALLSAVSIEAGDSQPATEIVIRTVSPIRFLFAKRMFISLQKGLILSDPTIVYSETCSMKILSWISGWGVSEGTTSIVGALISPTGNKQ